jgi:hypothetical protein
MGGVGSGPVCISCFDLARLSTFLCSIMGGFGEDLLELGSRLVCLCLVVLPTLTLPSLISLGSRAFRGRRCPPGCFETRGLRGRGRRRRRRRRDPRLLPRCSLVRQESIIERGGIGGVLLHPKTTKLGASSAIETSSKRTGKPTTRLGTISITVRIAQCSRRGQTSCVGEGRLTPARRKELIGGSTAIVRYRSSTWRLGDGLDELAAAEIADVITLIPSPTVSATFLEPAKTVNQRHTFNARTLNMTGKKYCH